MAYQVSCKKLGYEGCNWNAVSNTEDRLVDFVAVHARDHHGIKDFSQEMIANVKNSLGNVPGQGVSSDEPVMKEYRCPKCSWKYIAQTENLIVDAVALHARDVHGVKDFAKEMGTKVWNHVTEWTPAASKEGCGCHCTN